MKKVIKLGGCTVAVEVVNQAIGVTVAKSVFVFTEPATTEQVQAIAAALLEAVEASRQGVSHG